MSLGLKVTFLGATAFPMATYDCEAWAMTNLLIRSVVLSNTAQGVMGGKENQYMAVGQLYWVYFDVEKE